MTPSVEPPDTATDVARAEPSLGWPEMLARRGAQYALDFALAVGAGFLLGLLAALIVIPLVKWGLVPPMAIIWTPSITFVVVAILAELLIHVWVPLLRGGMTPGMLVMGLRVETVHGGQPSVRDYLIRFLVLTVDGSLLGLVALVSIVVTKRRQRVGDLAARTVVVRFPRSAPCPPPSR